MAEWLGRGLQNLVQRFESASDLTNPFYTTVWRGFLFFTPKVSLLIKIAHKNMLVDKATIKEGISRMCLFLIVKFCINLQKL